MTGHPILRLVSNDELEPYIMAFVDDCVLGNLSPRTIDRYRAQLMRYHWWCSRNAVALDPTQQTKADVRAFLRYLETESHRWDQPDHPPSNRPASNTTKDSYYRTLRRFFNWLADEGDVEVSPMVSVRRAKLVEEQPDPFNDDELQRLSAVLKQGTDALAYRNRAIVAVLLDIGLRASELAALQMEHYNGTTGDLIVVAGKGGKSRELRLGIRSRRQVRRYLMNHRRHLGDRGALFVSRNGEQMTRYGVLQLTTKLGELAGVDPCNPHRFRHTMAVNAARNDMDSIKLQGVLGHTSLEMVRRYVKLAESDVAAASERHSPFDYLKLSF